MAAPCGSMDFACYVTQYIVALITPYIIPLLIGFVAFIMLFFKKVRILGLLILTGLFLWYFGIPLGNPPLLAPVRQFFGM